ncbi:MAG TPA: symmetrical bis(5'-nucleosyl)-tetraphosphatase [Candidatus Binatia bacterium]|nr:symmetrical bis(5'-nucleosyl)-tetraphosphatase [Candidatus Binatia bacterium]
MPTYVIGDVQGCFDTLVALLERLRFDPASDRALFVGDLVNRGPRSEEMLRWAIAQGDRVQTVLGNHELHLIARHLGVAGRKRRDTIDGLLAAPDVEEVVTWLRSRPFAIRAGDALVVHAGLLPSWTFDDALALAREAEDALRGREAADLLAAAQERPGTIWSVALSGRERLRAIVQGLTQLRTCRRDGAPCLDFKGAPGEAPEGCRPWFEVPGPWRTDGTVIFGHWAALGLRVDPHAVCLDSGAAWGRALTALRLEDRAIVSQPVVEERRTLVRLAP